MTKKVKRKLFTDTTQPPKVGDEIYVDSACYMSHGVDDFDGGLVTVSNVDVRKCSNPFNTLFVSVEERPGYSYNWQVLALEQEELAKKFKEQRGEPNPDNSPESNCWD